MRLLLLLALACICNVAVAMGRGGGAGLGFGRAGHGAWFGVKKLLKKALADGKKGKKHGKHNIIRKQFPPNLVNGGLNSNSIAGGGQLSSLNGGTGGNPGVNGLLGNPNSGVIGHAGLHNKHLHNGNGTNRAGINGPLAGGQRPRKGNATAPHKSSLEKRLGFLKKAEHKLENIIEHRGGEGNKRRNHTKKLLGLVQDDVPSESQRNIAGGRSHGNDRV